MSSLSTNAKDHRWVIFVCLGFFCVIALVLRVWFSYDQVFLLQYVRFAENDPWYHIRAIEHLVAHFPHRLRWDAQALHPGGQYVGIAPLLDYLVAIVALALGAGHPSTQLVHGICAWTPAVLGALLPLPVYLLGSTLFDRRSGLLSAATIAVIPGPFLQRSLLGFTDHHVLESLLILLCGYFFIRLLKSEAVSRTEATPCPVGDTPHSRRVWWLAFQTGVFLGLYLLAWVGGSVLVLVFVVSFSVHVVAERARNRPVHRLCILAALAWLVALAMVVPFRDVPWFGFHVAALAGSACFLICAGAWAWVLRNARLSRAYFPLGLVALALVGLFFLRLADPEHFGGAAQGIRRFFAGKSGDMVVEAQSAFADGSLRFQPFYDMFQTGVFSAGLGVVFLLWRSFRSMPGTAFFLVWTVAMVVATVIQNRFGYYLAVNVAIASGFAWGHIIQESVGYLNRNTKLAKANLPLLAYLVFAAAGIAPSIAPAIGTARGQVYPHPDWHEAMAWLKEHAANSRNETASTNGVMCWCDHGYWVTVIGNCAPTSNPTHAGLSGSVRFFTSQDEHEASEIMESLDASYVVVDAGLPMDDSFGNDELVGAFEQIVRLGGGDILRLYEPYLEPQKDGSYKPILLYYPEYFRSMLNRLYLAGGEGYEPAWKTWLVHFKTVPTLNGGSIKRIEQSLQFKNYDEAVAFQRRQPADSWRLVGFSPQESCVPLEKLKRFARVYSSSTRPGVSSGRDMGYVQIFEFRPQEQ